MKEYICDLDRLWGINQIECGSKALSLAKLKQKGFKVPDGYVLTSKGFQRFCEHNKIEHNNLISGETVMLTGDYPGDLSMALEQVWELLRIEQNEALVVRSSAIGEDHEDNSFAGVYESIINIRSFKDMLIAVRRCWASCFSQKAKEYRNAVGASFEGIGVIIQKMVDGDVSGVLFTLNPISGNHDEVVVEAYPGLNFAVVDGTVQADRFIADKIGHIIQSDIHSKKIKYSLGAYSFGIDTIAIPEAQWNSPSLSGSLVKELVEISNELEKYFVRACDIEWTIKNGHIFILQCRPITAGQKDKAREALLYNSDIAEDAHCSLLDRYSEPASTCYLSLLQSWEEVVYLSFYSKLEGKHYKEKPLQFYFNRVYWNLKYQRDFFDDLPSFDRSMTNIMKRMKLARLMLFGYKSWYKRLGAYEQQIEGFNKCSREVLDIPELIQLLEKVIKVFCNDIGKDHFQFLGIAQVCYNKLAKKLSAISDSKEIIGKIIEANVCKNMTMISNQELLELAQMANSQDEVRKVFLLKEADEIYAALVNNEKLEHFRKSFEHFILKHGHRGTSCDDLYTPHWNEDYSIVLEIIKQFLTNSDCMAEYKSKPNINKEFNKKVVEQYLSTMKGSLLQKSYEAIKLAKLIELTTEYMALRENQRYYFDKSWVLLRKIILAIGDKLQKSGIVHKNTDMFHLTIHEIIDLKNLNINKNENRYKDLISIRKKAYERSTQLTPPYLIKNNDLIQLQKRGAFNSYKATGISPGKAIGPIRIVSSIKDLSLVKQGEIAVVSTFHPSWTPILNIVGGLVMNYGNILSHGAVVAREYNIPVVVFNDVATRLFQDGQWIEVDGTNGRIRIHNMDRDNKENSRGII